MMYDSKNVDREINYYHNKVKRAEREVERWRAFLTQDAMADPTCFVMQQFTSANDKFHAAEKELDNYMKTLSNKGTGNNKYQTIVDQALSTFHTPKVPPAPKRRRSETPMSSIEIPAAASNVIASPDKEQEPDEEQNNNDS